MYKIVVMGDNRVGKTSLRSRYMGQGFRSSYAATLGFEISTKETQFGKVVVYDLAGDHGGNRILRKQQYKGANGCFLVFSIVNRESFDNLDYWVEELSSSISINIPIFILGNKNDLRDEVDDTVQEDEGYQYAKSLAEKFGNSVSYLSTSALTGYNVEVGFNKLLTEITNL